MINKNSKIFIAGHNGMVGSACWRMFSKSGYRNLIGISSKKLDLRNRTKVFDFIKTENPDVIINSAAKVGGILVNTNFPYDFLMDNMLIQNNLIQAAHDLSISKFIFLGSSCVYPKLCPQPIKEEYLLSSYLESTNQWYAIAKISGVKLIESLRIQFERDYVSLMPTNLYGSNDNFDLHSSHVLPAMIRKFHEAKINNISFVKLWGTGTPFREFLHVDDLASSILFSLENKLTESLYNVGSGQEISIKNLAEKISNIVNFEGEIIWDDTMPDGTPRKLMDSSKIRDLGWKPKVNLDDGIAKTYEWYLKLIN